MRHKTDDTCAFSCRSLRCFSINASRLIVLWFSILLLLSTNEFRWCVIHELNQTNLTYNVHIQYRRTIRRVEIHEKGSKETPLWKGVLCSVTSSFYSLRLGVLCRCKFWKKKIFQSVCPDFMIQTTDKARHGRQLSHAQLFLSTKKEEERMLTVRRAWNQINHN